VVELQIERVADAGGQAHAGQVDLVIERLDF
jgi:hypothetical protein